MSENSPASSGLGVVTSYTGQKVGAKPKSLNGTILLLVIVGIASLLLCEQVITGWLALGERANISRRDLNPIELAMIAGTAIWGGISLWTALDFLRNQKTPNMRDYFAGVHSWMTPGILLSIALLSIIGVVSLVIAEQILTGWLPLGDRINIPRSDLNVLEITAALGAGLLGVITLRTVWGLWTRDKRAWTWAQWVVLMVAIVGLTLFLNGTFDIHEILPSGGSITDNLPGVQELTGPGLLLFLSCMAVYRFLAVGIESPPDAVIRNTLAKSPGAGAIIGFFAIVIIFSLGSDLFLEQRSLAGLLATNITRGIVAIGITFLMISGEFDLSVGSVYGAGALVFLLMMTEGIFGIKTTVIPAMLIALAFAALLGMINGLILIWTGIPSFIVTLGTLLAYRAILLVVVADGRILRYADYRIPPPYIYINHYLLAAGAMVLAVVLAVVGFSLLRTSWNTLSERLAKYQTDEDDLRDFWIFWSGLKVVVILVAGLAILFLLGSTALAQINDANTSGALLEISLFDLANGRFHFVEPTVNLRIGVLWWFLLVAIFQFVLTQTRYGNHVFAVGGNPGAARAQGINVNRVKVMNFMICSMLACTAGIINVARLSNVDPLMGDGLELEVIAASVIGGALLSGGYGSIFGSLIGVLIFGMLQTGLVLVGVDPRVFSGVIGVIIILAVVINTVVRRTKT